VSHMCDTAVRFESPASHMCDIVDYPYMCTSWLSIICLAIVVDYPYYQLLLITYICLRVAPLCPRCN